MSTDSSTGTNYWNHSKGIKSWLFTLDHKRIGLMYLVSVMIGFSLGGIFAVLLRLELIGPGRDIMGPEAYNQLFTLHGVFMIFLFVIPGIPAALGNFVLPLMLGAKDVAFPRMNLGSYYLFVLGTLVATYAIVFGGVDTGWTFYAPYSASSKGGITVMVSAAFILGFSSIFTGINFIVTIHKLRAPGMTFFRMPLFLWSIYATSVLQILATPVLGITLLLIVAERLLGVGIFDPAMGGDPVLFQHFFWFYSHPAVYIMILPGMGIMSELISTFSKKTIFGYRSIAYSSIAIAVISFFVWGHHMFVSGQTSFSSMVFSFLTFAVAIPSAIKIFNWVATLYKGSISLKTPMLFALSFIILFSIGGLTGPYLATISLDVHLHDTYFVVAHFHYTMMGGTAIAFFGGLHYWWPKMTGKMYSEKPAVTGTILVFIGFNWTFLTQFVLGSQGMPRRYYDYDPIFRRLHQFSTYGSWVLGFGFLILIINLLLSLKNGEKAPKNPWGSTTLEWQTESPPIHENFAKQPIITGPPYFYGRSCIEWEEDETSTVEKEEKSAEKEEDGKDE